MQKFLTFITAVISFYQRALFKSMWKTFWKKMRPGVLEYSAEDLQYSTNKCYKNTQPDVSKYPAGRFHFQKTSNLEVKNILWGI